ncbi:peptide/nickel transport system substrate-binding protein [Sphingomonas gellani]|uniref:Peptide/nickel transport system substrate-binding protein n=1 Tax=Sphingomonas gellani TaxID=1166340 RepID=A0A1H7YMQ5_9SPHN|nr:ABC transporter substrate-binding protein [Sphingomonas gellani]SEM46597.1 peptide/nickel transport system substrate-binding protein [Sphingomonas gellani]
MPATQPRDMKFRGLLRTGRGAALLLLMLASAGCNRRPDSGAVIVSAIGGPLRMADPDRRPLDTSERLTLDSLAQGLVRFDATGQIEPGLAERWTVIDDGMTYIFRLRRATWPDETPVSAEEVVAALRRHVAPRSSNPLAPFLTAVDAIVAMTPEVIEVRLKRPRPDLLSLFAQPEMALLRPRGTVGTGPFRVIQAGIAPLLRPAPDPDRDPDQEVRDDAANDVRLIGESAAMAVARFAARRSDLVEGGTFADWPLVAAAQVAPVNIRTDTASGLFGLAILSRDGFLADPRNRAALSEAVDRAAVLDAVQPGWTPTETLLPDQLDSSLPPAAAPWTAQALAERRLAAAAQVALWPGPPVRLRLALPDAPGGRLLFARLAASLASIGVTLDRVAPGAPAELALVDAVAPYDSARWYLATACRACGDQAAAALIAARDAPTLAERSRLIAAADAALTADASFIPLARPLRWSLVAQRLTRWTPNARAWHPLNRLRATTTSVP